METKLHTRKDYLDNKCTHKEYYSQFINGRNIEQVLIGIGKKRILNSKDEHLNNIPLKEWDNLTARNVSKRMEECGDYLTPAGKVCIMKACARHIKENEVNND